MVEGEAASTGERILDKRSEFKTGKLDLLGPLAQPPKCPECTSQEVWKDGLRYTKQGEVQRWLCRTCGHRFSKPNVKVNVSTQSLKSLNPRPNLPNANITSREFPVEKRLDPLPFQRREDVASHNVCVAEKPISTFRDYNRERQVCVSEREAKNLSQQPKTRQKQAAGATKQDQATIKGKIVEYAWWQNRNNIKSWKNRTRLLRRLVKLGANLWKPDTVKDILAKQNKWTDGYKATFVTAYTAFLEMEGLTWDLPKYKPETRFPFIPTEAELDQLIASCGKVTGTFLQGLKDTAADPGELARIKWIDLNKDTKTVAINYPVKGHNPRIVPISNEFLRRVETLPRKYDAIFKNYGTVASCYYHQRKTIAAKLGNPRLRKISFITFRHWKATMEYHRTKDILYVKELLGHKSINNTLIYIRLEASLFNPTNDEFTVRVCKNVKEACALVETGFEYVTGEYNDGGKIFRKRK